MALIDEAAHAGARRERAAAQLGLTWRTAQRWRGAGSAIDGRHGPRLIPHNRLSDTEPAKLLALANRPDYRG